MLCPDYWFDVACISSASWKCRRGTFNQYAYVQHPTRGPHRIPTVAYCYCLATHDTRIVNHMRSDWLNPDLISARRAAYAHQLDPSVPSSYSKQGSTTAPTATRQRTASSSITSSSPSAALMMVSDRDNQRMSRFSGKKTIAPCD